jgi:hypothetical protein
MNRYHHGSSMRLMYELSLKLRIRSQCALLGILIYCRSRERLIVASQCLLTPET